jgi:hypothetical protein
MVIWWVQQGSLAWRTSLRHLYVYFPSNARSLLISFLFEVHVAETRFNTHCPLHIVEACPPFIIYLPFHQRPTCCSLSYWSSFYRLAGGVCLCRSLTWSLSPGLTSLGRMCVYADRRAKSQFVAHFFLSHLVSGIPLPSNSPLTVW